MDAPAEIARRRGEGQDVGWLVDAVDQLPPVLNGMRELMAAHRVGETLKDMPSGDGLQLDELSARSGLPLDRLIAVLRQMEAAGLLGHGPHSL